MQARASSYGGLGRAGTGAAIAVLIAWGLQSAGIVVPDTVAAAIAVLCSGAAGYVGAALAPLTKE